MNQITTITVSTGSSRYEVEIGMGLLASVGARVDALLGGALSSGKVRAFVVTSPEIWKLHGAQLSSGFVCAPTALMVESGEQHKRLATLERLAEQLSEAGADRDSILIAFAGGVVGDMTGFLAAAYMRGIRYVQVPTTLLAQVDSAIGGKTGVNLATGKNLFGAFHHPLAVYADTAVLGTLPPEQLRAGLQESVKAAIIRDPALFDVLERHYGVILDEDADPEFAEHEAALTLVVAASVRVKAEVVSADEREGGLRMVLNLGHTLGHAIEAATHYKALLHGEAVAWGMIAATDIALQRKLVTTEDALRINRVIRFYGPLKPFEASVEELVALTARDKKNRSGSRSFVLPVGIGNAVVVRDVTVEELTRATERMMALVAKVRAGEFEA